MSHVSSVRLGATALVGALLATGLAFQPAAPAPAAQAPGMAVVRDLAPIAAHAQMAALAKKKGKHSRGAARWRLARQLTSRSAPGATFHATLRLKAKKSPRRVAVLIRQVKLGKVTARRTVTVKAKPRKWRKVSLALRAPKSAGKIQVWARYPKARLKVRTVALKRAAAVSVAGGWRLSMSEDFNSLSSSRWSIKNETYADNEDSYLLARNVSLDDGTLRIQGKKEAVGGRSYTSGYVHSMHKYTLPNYFRAEVRAKVPFEQGLWAAPIWFRPDGGGDGEIDLVETYGKEASRPVVHQTIHTEYGATHRQLAYARSYSDFNASAGATGWHTYTLEKVPGRITMWVDGEVSSVFTADSPDWYERYFEAGKRWDIRINMQIGGDYGGLPNGTTDWSPDKSAMQLDYVKTWVPD